MERKKKKLKLQEIQEELGKKEEELKRNPRKKKNITRNYTIETKY